MSKSVHTVKRPAGKILYGGVYFKSAERKAIDKVLDQNWWGPSVETESFEHELARIMGVAHALFVNSGSSALDIAVRVLNLPKGSEVIVPACTFPTPVASLIREGLKPVVVDIEPENYFISPKSLERSISSKASALLLVYVAGIIGNLEEILHIARKHNLKVIEDVCDGFGGTWDGKMIGSFGDVSAISTHAAHIISTGSGGVLFTNSRSLIAKARSIRDWGRVDQSPGKKASYPSFPPEYRRYIYTELGSYLAPLELQSAMGRVQLKRLAYFKRLRARNFAVLYKALSSYKDKVILPEADHRADCCWYTFPLTLSDVPRKRLINFLDKNRIEWRPILAGNIARQPAFKKQVIQKHPCPNADRLITDGLWVPIHPQHPKSTIEYIASVLTQAIA